MPAPNGHADFSGYSKSIFLPYVHEYASASVPMIRTTIGERELDLPMDTGSTGLLMGAPLLPDVSPNEGTPAYKYLTSSNILYTGRLVDVSMKFHGKGDSYATATVPVLVVDKSVVCPWYDPNVDTFECPYNPDKPKPRPRDISRIMYMGVGFGRNRPGDGQPNAVPAGNPFLNIDSIDGDALAQGSMRTGYTISTEGVHLGLTGKNTRDFVFTALEPGVTHDEDPRDWAMVRVCFSLNDKGSNFGYALVDTGIPQMYLRTEEGVETPNVTIPNPNPDGNAKWVKRIKPGTRMAIDIPSSDERSVAGYSFVAGEGASMEPSYVVPEKQRSPPFVNTGRNVLFGYAVAFDAIGGRFGFRPVRSSSSARI